MISNDVTKRGANFIVVVQSIHLMDLYSVREVFQLFLKVMKGQSGNY